MNQQASAASLTGVKNLILSDLPVDLIMVTGLAIGAGGGGGNRVDVVE